MSASFHDELARLASPDTAAAITKELSGLTGALTRVLSTVSPREANQILRLFIRTILADIAVANRDSDAAILARMLDDGGPSPESIGARRSGPASGNGPQAKIPVPPEVVRQALRDFDEKETAEAIRQIRETGGLTLGEFYEELERLIRPTE